MVSPSDISPPDLSGTILALEDLRIFKVSGQRRKARWLNRVGSVLTR
jgi:hypothetical protein